jgi:hypothetical protein
MFERQCFMGKTTIVTTIFDRSTIIFHGKPPVFIIFDGSSTSFHGERPISRGLLARPFGRAVAASLGASLGPHPTGSNGASLLSTARPQR